MTAGSNYCSPGAYSLLGDLMKMNSNSVSCVDRFLKGRRKRWRATPRFTARGRTSCPVDLSFTDLVQRREGFSNFPSSITLRVFDTLFLVLVIFKSLLIRFSVIC